MSLGPRFEGRTCQWPAARRFRGLIRYVAWSEEPVSAAPDVHARIFWIPPVRSLSSNSMARRACPMTLPTKSNFCHVGMQAGGPTLSGTLQKLLHGPPELALPDTPVRASTEHLHLSDRVLVTPRFEDGRDCQVSCRRSISTGQ